MAAKVAPRVPARATPSPASGDTTQPTTATDTNVANARQYAPHGAPTIDPKTGKPDDTSTAFDVITSPISAIGNVGDVLSALGKGETYIRAGEFVGGIVCLFMGVSLLAREMGVGNTVLQIAGAVPGIDKAKGVATAALKTKGKGSTT